MTKAPDLELVQALASRLAGKGEASIAYLTAEFQPFSNAQRPDLIFRPSLGGWAGQTVVMEVKLRATQRFVERNYSFLVEHKGFCEEALDLKICKYLYVTDIDVPEFSRAQLAREGIAVVLHHTDPETTARAIAVELDLGG